MVIKENKSLEIYREKIKDFEPLSSEEETKLIKKVQKGNKAAKKRMLEANLKFVYKVAHTYKNQGIPFEDLISAGNLGLIDALNKFDGNKNFKFISYAIWWIRRSILMLLADQSRPVKYPPWYTRFVWQTRALVEELETKRKTSNVYGEVATILDKEKKIKITPKKVEKAMSVQDNRMSFDRPTQAVPYQNFCDTYYDPDQSLADNFAEKNSEKEMLYRALDKLKPRERKMIVLRYGLEGSRSFKLLEIAIEYTLTRERVRQIITRAEAKLRDHIKTERMITLKKGWQ